MNGIAKHAEPIRRIGLGHDAELSDWILPIANLITMMMMGAVTLVLLTPAPRREPAVARASVRLVRSRSVGARRRALMIIRQLLTEAI